MLLRGGLRVWAAVLVVVCGLLGGCGEEVEEAGNASDLHAVASVLEMEGPTGPLVKAQLIIFKVQGGVKSFVEDADEVTMSFDGLESPTGVLEMDSQRVRLKAPEGGEAITTTFYQLDSVQEQRLVYKPGTFYQVTFRVDGVRHNMFVTTPEAQNEISKASEEAINKKLELVSSSNFDAGIIQVDRLVSMDTTFVSYPYDEPFLTSVQDVIDTLGQLSKETGSLLTVPPEAFRREGTHRVIFVGLSAVVGGSENISPGLGSFSGMFAGRSAQLDVNVR